MNRRDIATFLVVAFGAGWLITTPLWTDPRGLAVPYVGALLFALMFAPTLGVLAVALVRRRWSGLARETGLRGAGFRTWWPWALLAWIGPLVCSVAAIALATAVGVFRPDLTGFSGLAARLQASGVGALPIPLPVLAWLQVAQILVVGWLNVIGALGEEWGWRGWLLPALLPLGRWPAILLVGVVWGLWHTPILLLGYNYPGQPRWAGVALMVGFCVATGSLLGWLRLRSGSVWPCAIGHGFLNAAAGLPLVVATAGQPVHNASTGLLGWTGWVVCALALGVTALVVRRRTPDPVAGAAAAT